MTQEELQQLEESSQAFKVLATPFVEQIVKELDINAAIRKETFVSHTVETEPVTVHGAEVNIKICRYGRMGGGMSDDIGVEVTFSLPEDGVLADTYLNHVAAEEGFRKNHGHKYAAGPRYRDYSAELGGRQAVAYSPWHNRYLDVSAKRYTVSQMEEAVRDTLALARPLAAHLSDLAGMRYWNPTDEEVVAKAREIAENADLRDEDVDRETRSHWLRDAKSFFKGWFNPWNDRGRGTFDTLWPSSVDYAASAMGIKGSFEYAVACVLLEDEAYIAKARKACRIREESVTVRY